MNAAVVMLPPAPGITAATALQPCDALLPVCLPPKNRRWEAHPRRLSGPDSDPPSGVCLLCPLRWTLGDSPTIARMCFSRVSDYHKIP